MSNMNVYRAVLVAVKEESVAVSLKDSWHWRRLSGVNAERDPFCRTPDLRGAGAGPYSHEWQTGLLLDLIRQLHRKPVYGALLRINLYRAMSVARRVSQPRAKRRSQLLRGNADLSLKNCFTLLFKLTLVSVLSE